MKVNVSDECIACELCVSLCPDVFEMGDQFAEVKVDDVPTELEDDVRQAADECPTSAIIIEE